MQAFAEAIASSPIDDAAEEAIDHADRESLEAARDVFVDRLHRRSDDFDATRILRLVNAALQRLPAQTGTVHVDS